MDGLVRTADTVLQADQLSVSLQELHGSILALSKKIQTLAASEEIDRLIGAQAGYRHPQSAELVTNEQRLEALKEIYRQFLTLQELILKKQDERIGISNNVLVDYSNDGRYSDQMTRRLSLVSRLSQDSVDLKGKMNSFLNLLGNFETKMKVERLNLDMKQNASHELSQDNWTRDSASERSGFSNLQSAFDLNQTSFVEQKQKMEGFMGVLDNFKNKMVEDDEIMKSESQSAFSDSKQSGTSTSRYQKAQKDNSGQKPVNYFSRSEQKQVPLVDDQVPIEQKVVFSRTQVVTSFASVNHNSDRRSDEQGHASLQAGKQRGSIIDQIKMELQDSSPLKDSQQDSLLTSQPIVFTPEKINRDSGMLQADLRVQTPPRSVDDLFESLSERTFNEAEKLNMGQIWQNIKSQGDQLAARLNDTGGHLRSELQSDFGSVASRSQGQGKPPRSPLDDTPYQPSDLAARLDFKK
jgi:hypothetical protein